MLHYRKRLTTTRVILHCTHTPPSHNTTAHFMRTKGRELGLLDAGCHYLITRDGKPIPCRPVDAVGTHLKGYNEVSIGVFWAGGVNEDGEPDHTNITEAQRECLAGLMAFLSLTYGVLSLDGHSELVPGHKRKCCPANLMETLRCEL